MYMKRIDLILATALLAVTTGCGGGKQSSNDLITVDVTKSYSSKKELILQDFMDVEYVALETNDDFLNQGVVMDIGKEIILVKNRINDGDIFVYDRTGKALRKINRKGQKTSEEYTSISEIVLDEDNNEMYINNSSEKKILVYDLYGKFKRSFEHKEFPAEYFFYTEMFNYNNDNLFCYTRSNINIGFLLISKQDGNITKEIKIPFKEKKVLIQTTPSDLGGIIAVGPGRYSSLTPFNGNWVLLEISSDTVFTLLPDFSLRPFIVRTPTIQSMEPEVMLILRVLSDRYLFFETVKNEYNFNTRTGFQKTYLMYDKQEKAFSGYNVYNGDYSTRKEINLMALIPVSHEIGSWQPLEAYQLVEDYKAGRLKEGKLKEIASKLDAEDNPVIMLIKHKK